MSNALAHEKSPYLLQHAENPVDWMPWGEKAFAKARAEQKPIFLSIGYATCHWCHVMAHESFENPDVAALLNASFIPVKVDREERPDVDKVYMNYVQAMTGHGGWPLSAWLTPELTPFFGGTYFPPEDRSGRAGFRSLLGAIAQGWAGERDKLVAEGDRVIAALREHLARHDSGDAEATPSFAEAAAAAFEKGFQYFYESFDPHHAGFGGAPKFPRASNLNFLFRAAALQGLTSEAGKEAVELATATCRAMARGGIHDHVGGGYHRYSVDEAWFVPHFEKMLYDQAQIASNALEARQATGDERFAWMARDIFDYVLRDLTDAVGGFYSAEDADSATSGHAVAETEPAHAEGAFYVWSQPEIQAALGDDAPLFCAHFGVAVDGNVPPQLDPQREFVGKNILAQRQSLAETAQALNLTVETASERLHRALEKLQEARARRPRPLRDDKVITAWNGLMISALAKAHLVLGLGESAAAPMNGAGHPVSYIEAAVRAARFVQRELYDPSRGVLFRSWRGQRGRVEAFAEDYAFLIQGLLDLYEGSFDVGWLKWAERLQATMDGLFWDTEQGGYFNSRADDPEILLRLKEDYDGAEPAASSVAALNLLRLGAIFDSPDQAAGAMRANYREKGRRCLAAFRSQWSATPHALPQMLCAFELTVEEPMHVVLAGDPASVDFRALQAVLHETLRRRFVVLGADGGEGQRWLAERAPWLAGMAPRNGKPQAYVCRNFACETPVVSADELRFLLEK